MSRYSNEEREKILADMRQTLEQLDAREAARAERRAAAERNQDRLLRYGIALADPRGLERDRAEQLEAERKREQERAMATDELNAARTRDWEKWADARIDRALAAHDRNLNKVLGEVVAELRKETRQEIKTAVAELRAEVVKQRGIDDGEVIDLPSPVIRKVKVNAA
jgi:hypothetical protein